MEHPLIQEAAIRRPAVRDLLAMDPDDYTDVRELWKAHSKAEDARDVAGLMATLTDDCVYELVQSGHRWEGHEGATRFYTELLTAFPDVEFSLTNIFIGPQGVCEEAVVVGTHQQKWLDFEPTGGRLVWRNVIFFPWDRERRLFTGERIYTFFPGFEEPTPFA